MATVGFYAGLFGVPFLINTLHYFGSKRLMTNAKCAQCHQKAEKHLQMPASLVPSSSPAFSLLSRGFQRQGHLLASPSRPTPKLSPVSLCILGLTQNYYKMIHLGYNFRRTNGALWVCPEEYGKRFEKNTQVCTDCALVNGCVYASC